MDSRKEHRPKNNVVDMAAATGIKLLTEEQYRELRKLGEFDTKTSSWLKSSFTYFLGVFCVCFEALCKLVKRWL